MAVINDGFSTIISLGGTNLFEKEVTPPGIDGGGANDTTTMRNTIWRTMQPKKLKTLSESNFVAAYAIAAYSTLLSLLQVNQLVTVTFPDGATLAFWGWLDKFTPNASKEGEQPTANCTLIPSNQDDSGAEIAPVYTPGP
jgi:hypothetical protein